MPRPVMALFVLTALAAFLAPARADSQPTLANVAQDPALANRQAWVAPALDSLGAPSIAAAFKAVYGKKGKLPYPAPWGLSTLTIWQPEECDKDPYINGVCTGAGRDAEAARVPWLAERFYAKACRGGQVDGCLYLARLWERRGDQEGARAMLGYTNACMLAHNFYPCLVALRASYEGRLARIDPTVGRKAWTLDLYLDTIPITYRSDSDRQVATRLSAAACLVVGDFHSCNMAGLAMSPDSLNAIGERHEAAATTASRADRERRLAQKRQRLNELADSDRSWADRVLTAVGVAAAVASGVADGYGRVLDQAATQLPRPVTVPQRSVPAAGLTDDRGGSTANSGSAPPPSRSCVKARGDDYHWFLSTVGTGIRQTRRIFVYVPGCPGDEARALAECQKLGGSCEARRGSALPGY